MKDAYAYLRVSGKSQVDGDGFPRQIAAIEACAARQGVRIVDTFPEEGVSGASQWADRPKFSEMIARILDDGPVKTIIVENLTRLAREYVVQDAILLFLASHGVDLISADTGENITEAVRSDPMKKALIQMQAVFSELEKNSLVRKLKAARERKKEKTGRCEGILPYGEKDGEAKVLTYMRRLRSYDKTVRQIATKLNKAGIRARNGGKWTHGAVAKILARGEKKQVS